MLSKEMVGKIKSGSMIRKLFEEGAALGEIYGPENVCDFSLGNPNIAAPDSVKQAFIDVLNETDSVELHGYMSNVGFGEVREAVADSINRRFGMNLAKHNIIMCTGAAAGMNIALKCLLNPGDEVIAFAPYFVEYGNYVSNHQGVLKVVKPNLPTFKPNAEELEKLITDRTRVVIINSPNNPTGIVYTEEDIKAIAAVLEKKQKELGTDIYILADEPYRELVYDDDCVVPFIPKYYRNTIVGYSWSKSLSLPGERIGYVAVPSEVSDYEDLITCLSIANRILGFVNAPALQQKMIERCLEDKADIGFYKKNRDLLYKGVCDAGFECAKPDGAFYLWVKSPVADEMQFVEVAKKHLVLVVAGKGFACPGYVRLAYCTSTETIEKAIPRFKEIYNELKK